MSQSIATNDTDYQLSGAAPVNIIIIDAMTLLVYRTMAHKPTTQRAHPADRVAIWATMGNPKAYGTKAVVREEL